MNSGVLPIHGKARGPLVVVLNGPAGVGKTTTARALAATARNGAAIHGDSLRDFMVTRRDGTMRGLGYRNGASVASNFVKGGYELVVFEYVFESTAGIDAFCDVYDGAAPVHFFTLWASLEVVVAREGQRKGRDRLGSRVESCYRAIESKLEDLGPLVDASERGTGDVVADILDRCSRGEGLIADGLSPHQMALAS